MYFTPVLLASLNMAPAPSMRNVRLVLGARGTKMSLTSIVAFIYVRA